MSVRCIRQNRPPHARHLPPSNGVKRWSHAAQTKGIFTDVSPAGSGLLLAAREKCMAKTAKERSTSKRELIDTGTDKRMVKGTAPGRFKESDDVGRSLSADRRRTAKRSTELGYGDQRVAGRRSVDVQSSISKIRIPMSPEWTQGVWRPQRFEQVGPDRRGASTHGVGFQGHSGIGVRNLSTNATTSSKRTSAV